MIHYRVYKVSLNEGAAKIEGDLDSAGKAGYRVISVTSYHVVTHDQTTGQELVEPHALIVMERQDKRRRK